jgi:hypothetical protein
MDMTEPTMLKKQRAKARWSILRNALLQKASQESREHSIHRFAGYQLLKPSHYDDFKLSHKQSRLTRFEFRSGLSAEENYDRLEISILAISSCFPAGSCLEILNCANPSECIEIIKKNCQSVVNLLVVDEKKTSESLTILVQEVSGSSTKYKSRRYYLDDKCSLYTREPIETRLSLQDLVSHRTTGVDNTGNICVWDSERTLAYLLYHHLQDFSSVVSSSHENIANILELGTGMAGLAAISLGLRLVQNYNKSDKINVLLTDGHIDGVKNNLVNQYITGTLSTSKDTPSYHPYQSLNISARVLLWTTDAEASIGASQDVILVSDCTHFQDFHSALAITVMQVLRRCGFAIFCQPKRGDSLGNFVTLLKSAQGLASLEWITHPVVEQAHAKALKEQFNIYDKNLHHPSILVITKLRDMTEQDRQGFIHQQKHRKLQ